MCLVADLRSVILLNSLLQFLRDETEFLGEIFNRVALLWVHVGRIINPTWSESVNDRGIGDA
jgi:hypothetical protein